MGEVKGISYTEYPEQSDWVGRRVSVCYGYDTQKQHAGVVVRCDMTEPGEMIIQLDNGRFLRSVECMYSFEK